MASSIFYKFKNSREPERIVFSGTNLNVFELKREIIAASGLGDGTDFNLHMYPEDDLATEYKDDTVLIPRSATVVCIRRPAPRGQGRAARYVSGKAPVRAITKDASKTAAPLPLVGGATAEEDAEAAFLRESAQVWDAQKAYTTTTTIATTRRSPSTCPHTIRPRVTFAVAAT
jgi:protein MPE1